MQRYAARCFFVLGCKQWNVKQAASKFTCNFNQTPRAQRVSEKAQPKEEHMERDEVEKFASGSLNFDIVIECFRFEFEFEEKNGSEK